MGERRERASTSGGATDRRSILVGLAVGVGVALSTVGIVFSVIAIPLYALASFDDNGLDRPFIRTGLFQVALPAGLLSGLLAGVLVGLWHARGGRLPTDRTPFYE